MNTKQLAILVAVGLALGGAGLYVRNQQSAGYRQSSAQLGGLLLSGFDASSLTGVRITQGTNQLSVLKSGNDWTVKERGGYPANFGSIQDFVRKLVDLKATQPLQVGPSRLPVLELVAPDKGPGVLVELLGADGKPTRSLILGKKHTKGGQDDGGGGLGGMGGAWPIGRYVMVDNKIETAALVNEPLSNAEPKPDQWLDKEWFKIEQPVSITVSHPEPTNSFSLTRTNEFSEWSLVDTKPEEKVDTAKTGAFSSLLSSPSFDDVIVDGQPAALGLDNPVQARIKTAGGWTYTVKLGKAQEGDRYPVQFTAEAQLAGQRTPGKDEKKEDAERLDKEFAEKLKKQQEKLKAEQSRGRWTYLVSRWSIESLLKKRAELMVDPKKDEAPSEADAVSSPVTLPKFGQ
ncbi:MAG: hypothetical protein RIT19_1318 [Verrucomicrobiota bacterium]|jgi:hypothetical protein